MVKLNTKINDKKAKPAEKSIVSIKGGNVNKRPISKMTKAGNILVRKAIASGDIANAEATRRKEQDLRTLYIRFDCEQKPETEEEIQKIHPEIKNIRILRQSRKKKSGQQIRYCFVEFESEEKCEEAKRNLSQKAFKGGQLFADFVGAKSANNPQTTNPKRPINPTRLFISGMMPSLNSKQLMKLFPRAKDTIIPTKDSRVGKKFAFVQFKSPIDAKRAFDASKDLSLDGHHLTVLFAKMTGESLKRKNEDDTDEPSNKKTKAEVDSNDEIENDQSEEEEGSDVENDEESDEEVENDQSDNDDDVEEVENDQSDDDVEEVDNDSNDDVEEVDNDSDDDDVEEVGDEDDSDVEEVENDESEEESS